ncbi:uncharacterized protein PAC_12205 [Phialocephala subalpina]|uniref:Uncharacterized protein n=1 Tax=Phialocephala subalpina TaxID=576137 RepID=A0A1L7XB95_9HELO|nr:uncharacterized protein PAC_12205 [Phialocephala subalpina]
MSRAPWYAPSQETVEGNMPDPRSLWARGLLLLLKRKRHYSTELLSTSAPLGVRACYAKMEQVVEKLPTFEMFRKMREVLSSESSKGFLYIYSNSSCPPSRTSANAEIRSSVENVLSQWMNSVDRFKRHYSSAAKAQSDESQLLIEQSHAGDAPGYVAQHAEQGNGYQQHAHHGNQSSAAASNGATPAEISCPFKSVLTRADFSVVGAGLLQPFRTSQPKVPAPRGVISQHRVTTSRSTTSNGVILHVTTSQSTLPFSRHASSSDPAVRAALLHRLATIPTAHNSQPFGGYRSPTSSSDNKSTSSFSSSSTLTFGAATAIPASPPAAHIKVTHLQAPTWIKCSIYLIT